MQKQIANAIPTWAKALERFSGVDTSERIALQKCISICGANQGLSEAKLHGELYISFTQSSDNPREHVRCESCRFNPSTEMQALEAYLNRDDMAHINALAIFPTMVMSRTRLRPYLSESAPIWGATKNCSVLVSSLSDQSVVIYNEHSREDRSHKSACYDC